MLTCYYHTNLGYVEKPGDYVCSTVLKDSNGTTIRYYTLPWAKIRCGELPNCAAIQKTCGQDDFLNLCEKSSPQLTSNCGTKLLVKGIYI